MKISLMIVIVMISHSPSFYRFVNQSADPFEAVEDDDGSKVDRCDLQPEMFLTKKRQQVEVDDFDDYQEYANRFTKSLCLFEESDLHDSFFEAILNGLIFKLSPDNKVYKDDSKKILGENFFKEFSEKKDTLQLDHSLAIFLENFILSMICLRQKIYFLEYMKEEMNFDMS